MIVDDRSFGPKWSLGRCTRSYAVNTGYQLKSIRNGSLRTLIVNRIRRNFLGGGFKYFLFLPRSLGR